MGDKDEALLFVDGNILHVGKLRVEEPTAKPIKEVFTQSFSFSCKADDNVEIKKLFRETLCGVDVEYRICGTSERRQYPRYPRKMKKALKKLTLPDQRMTRRMNKLMIKGL